MIRVAFQGENGAYSEEVIYQFFGSEVKTLPCCRFEDIFEAIESEAADYGAQPVENSTAGSINQAYDLLLNHDLRIWGEAILRVRHALLSPPGTTLADIHRVRSHPQALAQSRLDARDRPRHRGQRSRSSCHPRTRCGRHRQPAGRSTL